MVAKAYRILAVYSNLVAIDNKAIYKVGILEKLESLIKIDSRLYVN